MENKKTLNYYDKDEIYDVLNTCFDCELIVTHNATYHSNNQVKLRIINAHIFATSLLVVLIVALDAWITWLFVNILVLEVFQIVPAQFSSVHLRLRLNVHMRTTMKEYECTWSSTISNHNWTWFKWVIKYIIITKVYHTCWCTLVVLPKGLWCLKSIFENPSKIK